MYAQHPFARIGLLCLILMCPLFSWTQSVALTVDEQSELTIFQYLVDKEINRITITTDFTRLAAARNENLKLDATVVLEAPDYFQETMDVNVELRGRNRRLICNMPPLKLDFSKKQLTQKGLRKKGDKLKIVTHCIDEYEEEYLLREYWAYRMYNELTPLSFQVHLVRIRYVDTSNSGEEVDDQLAFIIESKEELAERLGGEEEDLWGLTRPDVDKISYQNTLLFQYMIGNDDWSMESPHNMAFIKPSNGEAPLMVPYDFDFSGLVNAPYARPNPKWGALSVLDRIPMGAFASKTDLQSTLNDFLKLKDNGLKCFEECAWLSERSKKRIDKYLTGFYKQVENTKKIERIFLTEK